MTISIIIPIYNVEQYIEECLVSVASQQNPGAHVECILVDDCSPDRSMDIVNEFVANYHGNVLFRVLRHEVNRGVSAARNTGIKAATGEYVLFVDADDYLFEHCLAEMLKGLGLCPEADVVQMNSLWLGGAPYSKRNGSVVLSSKADRLRALVSYAVHVNPWNRLVRRTLLLRHGLFFAEGIVFEDYLWSYRLMAAASHVVVMPQVTYYYRPVPTSIMHSRDNRLYRTAHSWDVILTTMLGMKGNIRGCLLVNVLSRLLEIKGMESQQPCTERETEAVRSLQTKLLGAVCHCKRPLLMLFALTVLTPFRYVYSLSVVRRNYHKLERGLLELELMADRLAW